jgi:menaquinol-cytochrome c reductase cytochrome b/c subunit
VLKPVWAVPIATVGIPTLAMVLLLLLPFYDRNSERRPERRPIATTAGILTIIAIAYLTFLGATAGPPSQIDLQTSAALEPGKEVVAQSGCLACHKLGDNGNNGPGPELTQIGARLPRSAIARSLDVGPGIMPSYSSLPPQKLQALTAYLASLN